MWSSPLQSSVTGVEGLGDGAQITNLVGRSDQPGEPGTGGGPPATNPHRISKELTTNAKKKCQYVWHIIGFPQKSAFGKSGRDKFVCFLCRRLLRGHRLDGRHPQLRQGSHPEHRPAERHRALHLPPREVVPAWGLHEGPGDARPVWAVRDGWPQGGQEVKERRFPVWWGSLHTAEENIQRKSLASATYLKRSG